MVCDSLVCGLRLTGGSTGAQRTGPRWPVKVVGTGKYGPGLNVER
jgi:hypothetical protein